MSETTKTFVFLGAAAVALTAAFVGSRPVQFDADQMVGETLTDDFEVDVPKRLRIVTFDQATAATREFEVAEEDGLWRIPSKQGYPADATDQMADAATCLVNRQVLRVAAKDADRHEEFGVLDPTSPGLDSNSEGVGMRVVLEDANNEELIDLIIGDQVKDAENQRYVRRNSQDIVFVVELECQALSTDFETWIEDDLLQLNPMDVQHVFVDDYSFDLVRVQTRQGLGLAPEWTRRGRYRFAYEDGTDWKALELKRYDQAQDEYVSFQLGDDEELNAESLNELRTALDDLKIVDVERKPEGLSGSLKAGEEFVKNEEAAMSLLDKGFTPLAGPDGKPELSSSEGEVTCTTREGVRYVLRFGGLKVQTEDQSSGASGAEEQDEQNAEDEGLHRYLFVMAEFDESSIQRPELEQLPELPADAAESAEPSDPAASPEPPESAEAAEQDQVPAEEEEEEEEQNTADAAPLEPVPGEEANSEEASVDESSGEAAAATEEPSEQNGAPADKTPAEAETPPQETPADAAAAEAPADDPQAQPADDSTEAIIARRKQIEQENQRKLDEYQQTIESGQKKVKELNERFGDWYYVIDNSVYKKIHLGRDELIKQKETSEEATDEAAAEDAGPAGLPNLPLGDFSPSGADQSEAEPAEPAAE